jgi:hypothetical protein
VLTDTPASVSTTQDAPSLAEDDNSDNNPCCAKFIIINNSRKKRSQQYTHAYAPPSGSSGMAGKRAVPGMVRSATAPEHASERWWDGVGEQDGAPLRVGDGLCDAVEPLLRDDAHRCEPRHVRVQRCICG